MKEETMKNTEQSVDKLLKLNKDYKASTDPAEKARISDVMFFDTPLIWMMYKHKAYIDSDHPITTVGVFHEHCSKPGDICTKRFHFLNDAMVREHGVALTNTTHFPDDMNIEELYNNDMIHSLLNDDDFMKLWKQSEYFKDNDRVAKWENYSLE